MGLGDAPTGDDIPAGPNSGSGKLHWRSDAAPPDPRRDPSGAGGRGCTGRRGRCRSGWLPCRGRPGRQRPPAHRPGHRLDPRSLPRAAESRRSRPARRHEPFLPPLQFQKTLRLQTARTLLWTRSESVAEIAHRVGYESTSRFNREYRKMFGTSPGRDTPGRGSHEQA
ncbi:helix-turn-helix transcriptional regulator [Streptomyces olivaceoviridis]|uniref:helix-turn-helix transcriptional regulator n=1 Tax=Streptomyces olivaceoviridis TaxID=1921 RepID=UPI001677A97B